MSPPVRRPIMHATKDTRCSDFVRRISLAIIAGSSTLPPIYLCTYWADVPMPTRALGRVALIAVTCGIVVGTVVLLGVVRSHSRTDTEHRYRNIPRSRAVLLVFLISALACILLPYAQVQHTRLTIARGTFAAIVYEHNTPWVKIVSEHGERRFRIDQEFVTKVTRGVRPGRHVEILVDNGFLCQITTDGRRVFGLDEYENSRRDLNRGAALLLIISAFLYWLVSKPDVRRDMGNKTLPSRSRL